MGPNHSSPRHSRSRPTPRLLARTATSDVTAVAAGSADSALRALTRLLAVTAAREAFAAAETDSPDA